VAVQFVGGGRAVLHARRAKQIERAPDQPPVSARRLAAGCAAASGVFVVLLAPIVPLLLDQLAAYRVRGAGLNTTPSAVGINASGVARDTIGVYAVIANGVWAVIGYHGDRTMEQLGALWPLGMLGALAVLGRRTTSRTNLVVAAGILPAVALFAIGTTKRDLFELRYFALLAPLLLLLVARAVTTLTRGRVLAVVMVVLVAGSAVALVDQEGNGTNPRLYDFRGAVHDIVGDAGPTAEVALEPPYLDSVVRYYGPQLHTTRVRGLDPSAVDANGIDVLVTQRFIGSQEASAMVGRALYELEERFGPPQRIERPNVIVWRFR
jgi:hypothetical protein